MNSNVDNAVLRQDHSKSRLKAARRKFPNFKLCSPQPWVRKCRALDVATADRKSPPELEHPFKTISANPKLANKLVVIAK